MAATKTGASSATRRPATTHSGEQWAVFVWRLPTGSSTPRVTVWRLLRRLGAATLTPGAALLPWREDLVLAGMTAIERAVCTRSPVRLYGRDGTRA